jgi:hypothetical protein
MSDPQRVGTSKGALNAAIRRQMGRPVAVEPVKEDQAAALNEATRKKAGR